MTIGRRFFVTSLKPGAKLIARCVRQHWLVGNHLHWRLDVIFREEFQRCRSGNAATNLSLRRKISLNRFLKASPAGKSLKESAGALPARWTNSRKSSLPCRVKP